MTTIPTAPSTFAWSLVVPSGGFQEVEGLSSAESDADRVEGGTQSSPATFILKRGVVNSELFEWARDSAEGKAARRSGAIVLRDETREEMLRWSLTNAWVTKFEGPTLNATGNDVAMEEIHLKADKLRLDDDEDE
jgi:phage tail-like protein